MTPAQRRDEPRPVMLVKLGGSLITDKERPDTDRPQVIRRLAAELAEGLPAARERGVDVVLGHGSGSFGHAAAATSGIADGEGLFSAERRLGVARTQAAAAELHGRVRAALLDAGLAPYTVAPSSSITLAAGEPAAFSGDLLEWALHHALLPVLYGDVVPDRHRDVAICSTETAFLAATRGLAHAGRTVREALWLGATAGVYDEAGDTVPELTALGPLAGGPAAGIDVTGGMEHRVRTCLRLGDEGVASVIADGTVPGLLRRALAGEEVPGTRVPAADGR